MAARPTLSILVTGAAGYIGAHACVDLLDRGHRVIAVDNFSNSSPASLGRVEAITRRPLVVAGVDLRDTQGLERLFERHQIDAVVHFAGLKSVGESMTVPDRYYEINLGSTLSLLEAMRRHRVSMLVFSSSCTVYGSPSADQLPLHEGSTLSPINPYGRTKLVIENMLRDYAQADSRWRIMSLRYFNPVGAHPSGNLGPPAPGDFGELLPSVMQVAAGTREKVRIYGKDYGTLDGTCVRDYIHVMDLVRGHLVALEALPSVDGFQAINLGTGRGASVLEVISAAERASGVPIPVEFSARRSGDAASVYADTSLALSHLGWRAKLDLNRMCVDHWRWVQSGGLEVDSLAQLGEREGSDF